MYNRKAKPRWDLSLLNQCCPSAKKWQSVALFFVVLCHFARDFCSSDLMAGRRAGNSVSGMNPTRVAVNGSRWQLLRGLLRHLARPGGDPERGVFVGWAELRSLERKPHIWRILCQLIPSDTRNVGPWIEGVESPLFDRDNHASKARTSAGAGPNHHFRDVKSICQRLFILITSPRGGEVGRRPGEGRPLRREKEIRNGRWRPTVRSKLTLHQLTQLRTPSALSLYLLQCCDF